MQFSRLYLVDIDVAVHDSIDGKGGDALQAEFLHDVLAMGDDCGQADVEFVGYLLVDESLYDQRHDFYLTVGENFLLEDIRHGRHVLAIFVGILFKG